MAVDNNLRLADMLRTLRERALLSQEELAQRSGLSVGTVRGVEAGRIRRPRAASMRMLADALGLSGQDRDALVAAHLGAAVARTVEGEAEAGAPAAEGKAEPGGRTAEGEAVAAVRVREGAAGEREAEVVAPVGEGEAEIAAPLGEGEAAGRFERVVPSQLPSVVAGFTGRTAALKTLDEMLHSDVDTALEPVVISAIAGTAGVGKTTLALYWAHQVRDRFPDGQLYVNLRGFDPAAAPLDPAVAVRGFLDALQVPPNQVPTTLDAQSGLYRSLLAGRRMLILLDNARDAEQARPLLPGAPGCLVIVTSRNQLSSLIAANGARSLTLDLLTAEEAHEFLRRRLGAERIAADGDAVDEIITRCARLPLALAVVAARAVVRPGFALGVLARQLRETRPGLDALSDPDNATDVRAVFSWSYEALTPAAARMFRLLGLHAGPDITAAAAAGLAGTQTRPAGRLLAELADANLLSEHLPGRYTFHDLLRAYAAELTESHDTQEDRFAAVHRLLDHYLHTAHRAAMLINPQRDPLSLQPPVSGAAPEELADQAQALDWFAAEHHVLIAAIARVAGTRFDPYVWQLAWCTVTHFRRRGQWHAWVATQTAALAAGQRLADALAQAITNRTLAASYRYIGRYEDAYACLQSAIEQFRALGDRTREAHTHVDIAVLLGQRGRHRAALAHNLAALDLYRITGDITYQAIALNGIGWLHAELGDYEQALAYCRQGLALALETGAEVHQASAWDSLGYAHHHRGEFREAIACYGRAVELVRRQGDRFREADVLTRLGDAHLAAGEPDRAGDPWRRALLIFTELKLPNAEAVRVKLAGLA